MIEGIIYAIIFFIGMGMGMFLAYLDKKPAGNLCITEDECLYLDLDYEVKTIRGLNRVYFRVKNLKSR